MMDGEQLAEIISAQFNVCADVLVEKGKHYALDHDKLHNFRVAADVQGLTLQKALAGMMAKHTVSLYDMCWSDASFEITQWEEKITDHICYLVLLHAIIIENDELQKDFVEEITEYYQKNKDGNA